MPTIATCRLDPSEYSDGDLRDMFEISWVYDAQLPLDEARNHSEDKLMFGESILKCFIRYTEEPTSEAAFASEQRKWYYIAGRYTRYWMLGGSGWLSELRFGTA
jgi:hypothetical protein